MFRLFPQARNRNARTNPQIETALTMATSTEPLFDAALAPHRFKWTRTRFERAHELELWSPEDRLELVRGDVLRKEAKSPAHATVFTLLFNALARVFGEGFVIGQQLPFGVGDDSEPEPDTAVVVGTPRDFLHQHPTEAVLLVEIADSTLAFDLGAKAALYAQAGIEDYWVIDIPNRLVHVHRSPIASPSFPLGYAFQSTTRLVPTDTLSPLAAPDHSILVADLFS